MPDALTQTFGLAELIDLIQHSLMSESQKKALQDVLPKTTEADRMQIVSLIQNSNTEAKQIEESYQKETADLNTRYHKKLNELTRLEKQRAYQTFEKLDSEDKVQAVMAIEKEIADVRVETLHCNVSTRTSKHPLRSFLIALLLIASLAAGALSLMNYLNL